MRVRVRTNRITIGTNWAEKSSHEPGIKPDSKYPARSVPELEQAISRPTASRPKGIEVLRDIGSGPGPAD